MVQIHVFIKGRVKGVGFRSFIEFHALRLSLTGWVKNTDFGVESVFNGSSKNVEMMISLCKKGPALARVDSFELMEEPLEIFNHFLIK